MMAVETIETVSLSNKSIFILAEGVPDALSPADTILEMYPETACTTSILLVEGGRSRCARIVRLCSSLKGFCDRSPAGENWRKSRLGPDLATEEPVEVHDSQGMMRLDQRSSFCEVSQEQGSAASCGKPRRCSTGSRHQARSRERLLSPRTQICSRTNPALHITSQMEFR